MYINEDPEGDGDIKRMKRAVWVVLADTVLWFLTGAFTVIYWWRHRDQHTRFTGRAKV